MPPFDPAAPLLRRGATMLLLLLVVGAALLRLPGLASPPTDIHHVRQADTASIARNFWREGVDLLHPRIDWAGPDAGTVESELPLYAAATAGLWRVVRAPNPAVPRSLSALCWGIGALALFLLVRRRLEGPAWAYLGLYLLSPLAIAFSRTIQPDALALALLLLAMERADAAGDRDEGGLGAALLAGVLGGLAVAGKGTVAALGPLLVLLAVGRGGRAATVRAIALSTPLLGIPLAWYAHAHLHLGIDGATFGLWGARAHKWGSASIWLDPETWRALGGTLLTLTLTPLGAVLTLAGGLAARREPGLRPWALGLASGLGAAVLLAEGFRLHSYYQLMLVPFASVLAGAGVVDLWGRAAAASWAARSASLAVLLGLGALSILQGLAFEREALRRDERIEVAAVALSYVVPPGRSVVVVDRHPQTLLYAIDRRGWHRSAVSYGDVVEFEELGAEYLLLTDSSPSWNDSGLLSSLQDERPLVARSRGWLLFQLQRQTPRRPARASDDPLDEGEEP